MIIQSSVYYFAYRFCLSRSIVSDLEPSMLWLTTLICTLPYHRFAPDMPCHGALTTSPAASNNFHAPGTKSDSGTSPRQGPLLPDSIVFKQDCNSSPVTHIDFVGLSDGDEVDEEDGNEQVISEEPGFEIIHANGHVAVV